MQLLCRQEAADHARWKEAFDDHGEARSLAGLTLMQMWREADNAGAVWLMFDVNVRDKAEAFIDGAESQLFAERAGVTRADWHFVKPAF